MLNIRPLTDADYKILCDFWVSWGFEPIPKSFLPQDGLGGFIVEDENTPIVGGFLYLTNSKIAWPNWIISNRNYRKKPERKQAIELLINSLTNTAKQAGCTYAYALIKNSQLIDIYEKLGYTKGVSYNQELIKLL